MDDWQTQVVTILSYLTNIAVAVLVGVSICAISFAWDAGSHFQLSESMLLGLGAAWVSWMGRALPPVVDDG